MRLCIVGSRNFSNLELVRAFVRKLKPETIVVSGNARGVDQTAEEEALLTGHDVESWPVTSADWQRDGKRAGIERNKVMVDRVDGLVAFWDGYSVGTAHAVVWARSRGIWLRVYGPEGQLIYDK